MLFISAQVGTNSMELTSSMVAQTGDFVLPLYGLPLPILSSVTLIPQTSQLLTLARPVGQTYHHHPATLITVNPNTEAVRQRVERLQDIGQASAAVWLDLVHGAEPVTLSATRPRRLTSLAHTFRFFFPLIHRLSSN